ncbi:hypothetical protein MMC07_008044 [Pseudocyphellaria aurata]|nr:hypothetical protein [Pseudocyphellaria aurata]
MKVIQTVFLSLLLSLLCLLASLPSSTAYGDDHLPLSADWADIFSTLNCYCYGWYNAPDGIGPEQYRSGSYFGVNYYQREYQRTFNRTTLEVRNILGRLLHWRHNWKYQPMLWNRCVDLTEGTQICYQHLPYQVHARYTFENYQRILPAGHKLIKRYMVSPGDECTAICPEVVSLPEVTHSMCFRIDYKIRPICSGHLQGRCESGVMMSNSTF